MLYFISSSFSSFSSFLSLFIVDSFIEELNSLKELFSETESIKEFGKELLEIIELLSKVNIGLS